MVEILTPRLLLRTPSLADAAAVQRAKEEMWHDLQLWMSWSYDDQKTLEATQKYIASALGKSPHECLLGFRRDTGALAVSGGLAQETPGVYMTGYWVPKDQQGHGFATEATNAMIRYAFAALDAKAVLINYHEGNDKSRKVIEKLGFAPDGVDVKGCKRCLDGLPLDKFNFRRANADGLPELEVSWA